MQVAIITASKHETFLALTGI